MELSEREIIFFDLLDTRNSKATDPVNRLKTFEIVKNSTIEDPINPRWVIQFIHLLYEFTPLKTRYNAQAFIITDEYGMKQEADLRFFNDKPELLMRILVVQGLIAFGKLNIDNMERVISNNATNQVEFFRYCDIWNWLVWSMRWQIRNVGTLGKSTLIDFIERFPNGKVNMYEFSEEEYYMVLDENYEFNSSPGVRRKSFETCKKVTERILPLNLYYFVQTYTDIFSIIQIDHNLYSGGDLRLILENEEILALIIRIQERILLGQFGIENVKEYFPEDDKTLYRIYLNIFKWVTLSARDQIRRYRKLESTGLRKFIEYYPDGRVEGLFYH